ncbi:MAG: reprolysin-like metallopeptidase, partial [Actinomycetota bacterium]
MSQPDVRSIRPRPGGAIGRGLIAALTVAVVATGLLASGAAAAVPSGGNGIRQPGARLWSPLDAVPVGGRADALSFGRASRPLSYALDRAGMKARLSRAPRELTAVARSNPLVLSLPSPGGGFSRFAVQRSPVVAPELAARYPFIETYSGQGIDDRSATNRFDLGRTGFHAQVLSPKGDWYIDPANHLDQSAYVSYFARDLSNGHGRFVEHGVRRSLDPAALAAPVDAQRVVGTELRTYRLALAADGEYSQFHGGTVPLVHNALVVAVNRVTGVYERELSIRLQLVANNDGLIFLNPATDPYNNSNPSQLLTQNQTTVDGVIGNANYDIGHVFSTGGGGLAGLAVVGRTGQKARGETGLGNPIGDAFYIDYVAHEMGHQFGGNHSFNGTQGSCAGNGNASTAMEPGSGTTIMAYAGICGADDLQLHSDDYFHAISFDEIAAYTTTPGSPGNLGAAPSGNAAPTVSVNGGPFTIPIRTPFALSATGADANGDALSFAWEQYDGGVLRTLNAASKPTGVLFRSFAPVTTPTRVFPRMASVLANSTNANSGTCPALPGGLDCWAEFLPAVGRTLSFRVTVRDNHAGAGGVNSANVVVTAAGSAPFLVTSPNTGVSLPGGSSQVVTWNVAGTNAAPFGTTNVTIVLSTDGGAT